jgi:transcriptional antiterminator NusG
MPRHDSGDTEVLHLAESAKWYVVHTYSGYENKVGSNLQTIVENRSLQDVIQGIKIPTEMVTEIKDNVKREVERKIFPGYVLVKMELNDETWHIVRNTRGVTGFVGSGSRPEALTEAEVAQLGVEKHTVEVSYAVGDSVRIIDGPLQDFVGTVDELDADKNRVRVIVSMFGRETPVELELDQVEAVE